MLTRAQAIAASRIGGSRFVVLEKRDHMDRVSGEPWHRHAGKRPKNWVLDFDQIFPT